MRDTPRSVFLNRQGADSLSALLIGQRITGVDVADAGALGLRFEDGEVVLLAELHRDRKGYHEARLSVAWEPEQSANG